MKIFRKWGMFAEQIFYKIARNLLLWNQIRLTLLLDCFAV